MKTSKLQADISGVYSYVWGMIFYFLRSFEPHNTSLSCVLIHEIRLGEIHFPISARSVQLARGMSTLNVSLKEVTMELGSERLGAIASLLVFWRSAGQEEREVKSG